MAKKNLWTTIRHFSRSSFFIWLVFCLVGTESYALNSHADPTFLQNGGYELIIIVDKAVRYQGALSADDVKLGKGILVSETGQTLSVFEWVGGPGEQSPGWRFLESHDVSTGKEIAYKYKSDDPSKTRLVQATTRTGFYPVEGLFSNYVSKAFGEKMPFSIGYDIEFGTYIHATSKGACEKFIGTRRSAGCTRLCYNEAKKVFDLVKSKGMGLVQDFKEEMGIPVRNPVTGRPLLIRAHRTLVLNTDTTPPEFEAKPLPIVRDRPVVKLDPRRYQQDPELLQELFY